MRVFALLALLLVSSAPVLADDDIWVVVVGEVTLQPQLAAQLESWLRQHNQNVAPAALPPDAISTLLDCFVIEDEICATKVVEKRAKTQSVIFAKVDLAASENSPDKTVTITAWWFDKNREAIADRRFCERCTDTTLRTAADELMAALATAVAKTGGKLRLSSTPAGARVVIDGAPIGVTPLEYDLKSGNHTVTVSHADHRSDSREITIKRGLTTEVDVLLESEASRNFLPIIFLGAGAALLATGIVRVAIDEDVPEPVGQQKEFYSNTAPLGVGLALSGLVVGGIGGYLLFKQKRASAPVAAITSDTGYIGWAGSF